MAIKKVYCYLVSTVEGCDFANVLLNPQCHEPISLDKKEIEIKYVQEHSGQIISGILLQQKKVEFHQSMFLVRKISLQFV